MIEHCCDDLRRKELEKDTCPLNGIDFVEVGPDQRSLFVHLFRETPGFDKTNVIVEGGERVRHFEVRSVAKSAGRPVFTIRLDVPGDFSPYRLRLVNSATDPLLLAGFDPLFAEIDFSFKVGCPSDLDCADACTCDTRVPTEPAIDYLAKDYASFRRLILDRITQLVPGWTERSAADLGVTLAELLAYVGDHLSWRQDAVATEAYLETARLRTSLRRHALLVDYPMHDGCNARAWVHLVVAAGAGAFTLPRSSVQFLTRVPALPGRIAPGSADAKAAIDADPVVFEPLHDAKLDDDLNQIDLYAWGDTRCCLPLRATRATLVDHHPSLAVGDPLLFEEITGPSTGEEGDADPLHRQVVRLTEVKVTVDPLNQQEITEIAWGDDDALIFPLCLSSETDSEHGRHPVAQVSVARGNLVLADHGRTLADPESLGAVPAPRIRVPSASEDRCARPDVAWIPARYRPALRNGPLTIAGRLADSGSGTAEPPAFDPNGSARSAMSWSIASCRPEIRKLESTFQEDPQSPAQTQLWRVRRDLLSTGDDDPEFVVEVEHDGSARLRFGDGSHGRRPRSGESFSVAYRIGNGSAGNVGIGALVQVIAGTADVVNVRNPLPAQGGSDLEDEAVVRRSAPKAFLRLERAVSPADYVEITERNPKVQRAAASLRWTGSWHTVFIAVDRVSGVPLDAPSEDELQTYVDRYRMAGHDLEFDDPIFVSLEIEFEVCVSGEYFRSDVRTGILEALGRRDLPNGRKGLFHPDRLTFGQTVWLSPILAAARSVTGVSSVRATVFRRQGVPDPAPLVDGFLALSRLEIARLDNDPNFPEHGVLRLRMFGGK